MAAAAQFERLTFYAPDHTYRFAGELVPSVTQVLKSAGIVDYSQIPQDVLLNAARRGTAVHRALEFFDRDELDEDSLSAELRPYLEAYRSFLADSGFQPGHVENRVYHPLHRYAGTLDRLGVLNGEAVVLDFKTGIVLPGHAIQLAAYNCCLPAPRRFRRFALQLTGEAKYKLIEFKASEFQRDFEVFLAALACHRFQSASK